MGQSEGERVDTAVSQRGVPSRRAGEIEIFPVVCDTKQGFAAFLDQTRRRQITGAGDIEIFPVLLCDMKQVFFAAFLDQTRAGDKLRQQLSRGWEKIQS